MVVYPGWLDTYYVQNQRCIYETPGVKRASDNMAWHSLHSAVVFSPFVLSRHISSYLTLSRLIFRPIYRLSSVLPSCHIFLLVYLLLAYHFLLFHSRVG